MAMNEAAQTTQLCAFPGFEFLLRSVAHLPCVSLLVMYRKSRQECCSYWDIFVSCLHSALLHLWSSHLCSELRVEQLRVERSVVSGSHRITVFLMPTALVSPGMPKMFALSFPSDVHDVLDFHWVSPAAGTKCYSVCVFLL